MSEAGDYSPGVWAGHDFSSARRSYNDHVGRSYDDAMSKGKSAKDLVPDSLKTDSVAPFVVLCDVTGSMGEWPATIFSKLPYLDHEARTEYLGDDVEVSFAAVGDATCDHYPLQPRPFAKGKEMEMRLKELVIEGGGGGQVMESYELAALYYARKVVMPNAATPVLIFIGDEKPYDTINKDLAALATGVKLQSDITTKEIFDELKQKYSVYFVRKPYGNSLPNSWDPVNKEIHKAWADLVGEDRIAILPEAGRVVDVIFGILANETGRIEYFRKELEGRQRPEQVRTVYTSLASIHKLGSKNSKSVDKLLPPGRSVTRRKKNDEGKDATPLA